MKQLLAPRPLAITAMILGVVLYLTFLTGRPKRQNYQCQSNLKQLALAVFQYTRDYDETYPLTPKWKKGLYPYLRWMHTPNDTQMYACPTTARDYAFNSLLNRLAVVRVDKPELTALFYEPSHPVNADSGNSWSTSGIHWAGSNVCFNDGHVKWLTAKPTFLPAQTPAPPSGKNRAGSF